MDSYSECVCVCVHMRVLQEISDLHMYLIAFLSFPVWEEHFT